ncbi:MAG TPA: NAD(P)/FAD-dependent oxidoreductase [Candidatus Acidoferrales bacterium]|jgi:protoporphyrinogen oxidase|nr:NAD(P)/FAD-dependent oxidoreductase [Candidatus Acidoferrales bacterium]
MKRAVIIGAGPAGLTAGYFLSEAGWKVTIFEADPMYVGGISRTVHYNGFRFDIGGHRFFSKSKEVEEFWQRILGDNLIDRPRMSRIYYRGRFYSYPLKALEALRNLGIIESTFCVMSYLKAKAFPIDNPRSFEDWVINQFGRKLYGIFFKTYTEKVWGMDCKDISADWAAQRIKGLSLASAVKNAVFPPKKGDTTIKTLINSFKYPRLGPGMMWEQCAARIREMSGEVLLGRKVQSCVRSMDGSWQVTAQGESGETSIVSGDDLISTTAIRDLCKMLQPQPDEDATRGADALRYRDFLTVALITKDRLCLPDNWIYVHDPSVKVGRIQNFKSWSPELLPDQNLACYGLEYFCFEGDGVWTSPDSELIRLAAQEMHKLGLLNPDDVLDGCVVRQPKAYPVYDDNYKSNVKAFASEVADRYPTLHLIGRNGMHKYNNQDHAMMTAMLTAKNIIAGKRLYDVWEVNQDAEYHESGEAGQEQALEQAASGLRMVPTRIQHEEPAKARAAAGGR